MECLTTEEYALMYKIDELSLLIIRMVIQNVDYLGFEDSFIATGAIYAALGQLRSKKVYINDKFYVSLTKHLLITSKTQYKLEEVETIAK